MSRLIRNSIKIIAVLIFLAGFPAAFFMVAQGSPDRHVIAGIAAGFALLGLFVWSFSMKNPKTIITASIIILTGGLIAGFLIGYRIGYNPAPPWSWDRGGYIQVVVGPYMDQIAAFIPSCIFIVLGLTLFLYGIRFKRPISKIET